MKRVLPPLNALRAFEAAGRLGSFKEAAAELHVTHGAVSQHVRLLEEWLGAPLFERHNRRVVLTDRYSGSFRRQLPDMAFRKPCREPCR
jgi:LysR family glycine cleavage system transcriptional activator